MGKSSSEMGLKVFHFLPLFANAGAPGTGFGEAVANGQTYWPVSGCQQHKPCYDFRIKTKECFITNQK